MRALVTGAAGFIGSHLCDRLLRDGWEVIALDALYTGRWDNLGVAAPAFAGQLCDTNRPGLTVVQGAVEDADLLLTLPPCDWIIHLAGHVGVDHVLQSRHELLREAGSIWGLLECAQETGARLIVTSTSEVYGSSTLCRESDMLHVGPPDIARSAYAAAKFYIENAALAAHEADDVKVTVIRPFNVAGPRQRPDNVLARWLHAVAAGRSIIVHGGGRYQRAFTHVADFVEGLIAVAKGTLSIGRVVNIGQSAEVLDLAELARLTATAAGAFGYVARIELEHPDPQTGWDRFETRVPDLTLFHEMTGLTLPGRTQDVIADMARWAYGPKEEHRG